MANPFEVTPFNPLQALMMGVQGFDKGRDYNQQNQMAEGRKSALEALMAKDPNAAIAHLIGSGDTKSAAALAQYQQGANSVYGTPIYGTTPDGRPAIGTFDKQGKFKQVDTGGFAVTPGIKTIDTPQGTYVVGSKDGQPLGAGAPGTGGPQVQGQPQPAQSAPGFYKKDYRNTEADKVLGKETGEKQAAMGQAKSALDTNLASLDQFQQQAYSVLNHPGLPRITGMVGMLPNVPGFPGADAQASLDTLRTKTGFSALQAMRNASKTGGALGNVSDAENKMLQNSMVELQNAQTEKQIKQALTKLIAQIDGTKDRLRQAYETDYAGLTRPASDNLPAAANAPASNAPVTKSIGGKNYIQMNGQWYEQ